MEGRKEEFYEQLEILCSGMQKYDMIMILRDMNTKIGKGCFLNQIAGSHTLHDTSSEN